MQWPVRGDSPQCWNSVLTNRVDSVKDSLCICLLCYNRALWDRDELRCQLIRKEALLTLCHALLAAAPACFSVKNNSGLWMLMLSLKDKYFIGSIYAGMLWSSLGDVTKPFNVNFFDVQKKNLYRLLLCEFLRAGIGQHMNVTGGSGTRKDWFLWDIFLNIFGDLWYKTKVTKNSVYSKKKVK